MTHVVSDESDSVPALQFARLGPIGVLSRTLDPIIANALDQLAPQLFPDVRITGDEAHLSTFLHEECEELMRWPTWLSEWFRADIGFLLRLFSQVTNASHFQLRLECIRDDACRRFHVDQVRYRLVTTYRGPGTQWISPQSAKRVQDIESVRQGNFRTLGRGWVGILRGAKSEAGPGVLHRSPPIAGKNVVRFFLALQEDGDALGI